MNLKSPTSFILIVFCWFVLGITSNCFGSVQVIDATLHPQIIKTHTTSTDGNLPITQNTARNNSAEEEEDGMDDDVWDEKLAIQSFKVAHLILISNYQLNHSFDPINQLIEIFVPPPNVAFNL